MRWKVDDVLDYKSGDLSARHDAYDAHGRHFVSDYEENWVGCLAADHGLAWSAGPRDVPDHVREQSRRHVVAPLAGPARVNGCPDGSVLVRPSTLSIDNILTTSQIHKILAPMWGLAADLLPCFRALRIQPLRWGCS